MSASFLSQPTHQNYTFFKPLFKIQFLQTFYLLFCFCSFFVKCCCCLKQLVQLTITMAQSMRRTDMAFFYIQGTAATLVASVQRPHTIKQKTSHVSQKNIKKKRYDCKVFKALSRRIHIGWKNVDNEKCKDRGHNVAVLQWQNEMERRQSYKAVYSNLFLLFSPQPLLFCSFSSH